VSAPAVTVSRLGKALDPEIVVLKLTTVGGTPLALVWNFAIHGTMLSAGDLRLSGDVMGVASARLEQKLGAPALFVNGAVGDVSPAHHGERAMLDTARSCPRRSKPAGRKRGPGPSAPCESRSDTSRFRRRRSRSSAASGAGFPDSSGCRSASPCLAPSRWSRPRSATQPG
jgi:hypothetical protein